VLRVLTVNLKNGKADPSSLASVLDEVKPDVVAAQELAPDVAEVIASRLPHGRLEPGLDYRGMGIALVQPAPVEVRPLPRRPAYVANLEGWPGFPDGLTIVNSHLANPIDRPVRTHIGYRQGQVEGLRQLLDDVKTPVVVVGDMNSTPLWPAYRRLTSELMDLVAGRAGPTWGPLPAGPAFLRIDHVLGRGVRALTVMKRRITGSDHRAIVVELVPI